MYRVIYQLLILPFVYSVKYKTWPKPHVISSPKFVEHISPGFHVESPERIIECQLMAEKLESAGYITYAQPSTDMNRAIEQIKKVHDPDYVEEVKFLCSRGLRILSPYDSDTYISKASYEVCVLAQSAWLDAVDKALADQTISFALTRPPGHHAKKAESMGFCIFNFAAVAAHYAIEKKGIARIGILDFDVHFGNGVAALVRDTPEIRYTSLHQMGIFPLSGDPGNSGPLGNLKNIEVPIDTTFATYEGLLDSALQFLKEFDPELLIVCAGYDALRSDPMAGVSLEPSDYHTIARKIRDTFIDSSVKGTVFGLEGGYNVQDLPLAVENTIMAYVAREDDD
jgi:acetoin utilization deacetylase AcuC-like enzyme